MVYYYNIFFESIIVLRTGSPSPCLMTKKKNKKNQFDFYPSVYGSIMLFVKLVFSGNCTLRASKAVRSRTSDENGPKTWCATDYDFFFSFLSTLFSSPRSSCDSRVSTTSYTLWQQQQQRYYFIQKRYAERRLMGREGG